MTVLVLQILLVMAVFVAIGIVFGVVIRRSISTPATRAPAFAAEDVVPADTVPERAGEPPAGRAGEDETEDEAIIDPDRAAGADQIGVRPPALTGPRDSAPDDLRRIRGIGPQNEARLNALGIYHLDQIAAWTPEEARWVGAYLAFPGRIEREDWIGQAGRLIEEA